MTALCEFDSVIDPMYQGYNGAAGPFEAIVDMGTAQPPQHKGRLPLVEVGWSISRRNLMTWRAEV